MSSSSESLHKGHMRDNVYYDSSNTKKSMYRVERQAKLQIPFNSLNFGTTQIPFVIQNKDLVSHIVVAMQFAPGTLRPLPAENAIAQIQYQIGNSNQEQQYLNNAFLSKMTQFDSYEQRQFYLTNAGGNGGVIGANTWYYSVLNVPWSKLTRGKHGQKKLPIDTKLVASNLNIWLDLNDNTNVYSSGSPPAALVSAYIQPVYYTWVNPSDSLKLISVDMNTHQTVQNIYSYPIHYEKSFNFNISATGAQNITISGFLPGMITSISFYLLTSTFPITGALTNIQLQYNGDVLSRYDNSSYLEFNMVEKNTVDKFTVNSVDYFFYEIPFTQFNFYNNADNDYHYGPSYSSQNLQLLFNCAATGTLYLNVNYKKLLAFDGVTANII